MIDLHMHSSYSDDGEFTPARLVEICSLKGVRMMSVTDHNCVRANEEAKACAEQKGIDYVPGVEIDCVFEQANFHMLGYGIDYKSSDFDGIENRIREQCRKASLEMLEKTRELGFRVTEEEMRQMAGGSYWPESWTGEMFAETLLAKPEYTEHSLLLPYREGGSRSDNPYVNFYWDFYSQGKPGHVKMYYPQMAEIVELIHQNGGLAVLAHPGMNLKGKEALLSPMISLGIDGLEAFSSYHSPEQRETYFEEARAHKLFVTCGSDFHGKTKPSIQTGQHGCFLSEEEMRGQLFKAL